MKVYTLEDFKGPEFYDRYMRVVLARLPIEILVIACLLDGPSRNGWKNEIAAKVAADTLIRRGIFIQIPRQNFYDRVFVLKEQRAFKFALSQFYLAGEIE